MAESRLPHDVGSDPKGQRVGMLAAFLAVLLAVVSIASHRAHTAAILHLSVSNRQWARYEAASLKSLSLELRENAAVGLLGDRSGLEKLRADYEAQKQKYEQQAGELQESAEHATGMAETDERRALRYDVGEGLLEIAIFLTSFYFLSRRTLFPIVAVAVAIVAVVVAFTGLISEAGPRNNANRGASDASYTR